MMKLKPRTEVKAMARVSLDQPDGAAVEVITR